jgi:4-hydroxy-tetrahydrodipicolinate reductase
MGNDAGELAGISPTGVEVTDDISIYAEKGVDTVIHTSGPPELDVAYDLLEYNIRQKVDVISSVEELGYPFRTHPTMAAKLDALAKDAGTTVLGTGLIPGFLDMLMFLATKPCHTLESTTLERIVDISDYIKEGSQTKEAFGIGLSPAEFKENVQKDVIKGHAGGAGSIHMVAETVGFEIDRIEKNVEPIMPEDLGVTSTEGAIGARTETAGYSDGEKTVIIRHEGHTHIENKEGGEQDRVIVDGEPPINMTIDPCLQSEKGTVGHMVNMIPLVDNAESGLSSMLDFRPWGGSTQNMADASVYYRHL